MIEIRKEGTRARVYMGCLNSIVAGDIGWLRETLLDQLKDEGNRVILDIATIRTIDRDGFGMLQELTRSARDAGSRFMLCNVPDEIRELIILQDLEGELMFCLCDNDDELVRLDLG